MTKIKVGDWVRFYSNGRLVIGQVEYITKGITGRIEINTDAGTVSDEYILEVRSENK